MAIINKIFVLTLILAFGLVFDVNAQTKRRRTKPRRTPAIVSPQTMPPSHVAVDAEVVSRAEDDLNAENRHATGKNNGINPDLQKSALINPVKIPVMPTSKNNSAAEREDRSLIDLERLSLAEGRAEAFRKQLSDVIEREAALRSKIEQLDYQMRPEVIQSETATIGSLRPEEIRDSRRRMLENDKTRANDQLTTVMESRTRLEQAIINADALVDKLRARVEAETDEVTRKPSEKITSRDSTEPQVPDN